MIVMVHGKELTGISKVGDKITLSGKIVRYSEDELSSNIDVQIEELVTPDGTTKPLKVQNEADVSLNKLTGSVPAF